MASCDGDCSLKNTVPAFVTSKAANALSCLGILNNPMDEEHFTEALHSELYAFDDEDLPELAFPLSYAFLGKAQSTDVAILLKKQQKQNLFIPSNPLQKEKKQENSFDKMARLWFPKNYNQESSNGTTITLDIQVSTKPKKPLVNTFGGLK
jgi:hypothetical protein